MKLHWLQHVPFEGLGVIEEWANARHIQSATGMREGISNLENIHKVMRTLVDRLFI